jgi:acyl carrier protein
MDATFEQVKAMIVNEFSIAPEKVTRSTALTDLGVDSLAALEFVFLLEDAFHITVQSDADLRGGTVQDVVDTVEAALRQGTPAQAAA